MHLVKNHVNVEQHVSTLGYHRCRIFIILTKSKLNLARFDLSEILTGNLTKHVRYLRNSVLIAPETDAFSAVRR